MSVAHDEAAAEIVRCAKHWRATQLAIAEAMTRAGLFDDGGALTVEELHVTEAVTKAHADFSIASFELASAVDSYPG